MTPVYPLRLPTVDTTDPVLKAAIETCDVRWQAVMKSLEDNCHVSLQRAAIAEWVIADETVKRLIKEKHE